MKFVGAFLLVFVFFACSDEEKIKHSTESKEEVLIEQSDEKTEVNDTNVPLPVEDVQKPTSKLENNALAFLNGGGGG